MLIWVGVVIIVTVLASRDEARRGAERLSCGRPRPLM